jgi:hypothetical protein
MRTVIGAFALVLSTLSQAAGPQPQRYVFTTPAARYVIETNGMSSVEVRTKQRQLHTADYPFAVLKTASGSTPASRVVRHGATLTVTFGSTGIEADFIISSRADYFVVEVGATRGGPVDQLCFGRCPAGRQVERRLLGVPHEPR